jgi:hypothetical protein
MPDLTHEEFALLKHYRIRERVETEPLRCKAQQWLLNLGYIEEPPLSLMASRIAITADGSSALFGFMKLSCRSAV